MVLRGDRRGFRNTRRVHVSTEKSPRDTLKVGFLSDRLSPRSHVSSAQIVFPRGPALGASRHQPYGASQSISAFNEPF